MTAIIFFDLETSDKEFCGQILNYCFLYTGGDFKEKELLQGDVALSRLQIPSPGALLANRIIVTEHKGESEPAAMSRIWRFVDQCIQDNGGPVVLCGYNSARFDVPYLRTSFIRNGLNPYFNGKIIYRDVYHSVQFLVATNASFRDKILAQTGGTLSLKLEIVTKSLGLLIGVQTHESRDDVLLLRDLCRFLDREYQFDISRFSAYLSPIINSALRFDKEALITSVSIGHGEENNADHLRRKSLYLFRDSPKQALWLDLDKFNAGKGKESLSYFTKATASLFVESARVPDASEAEAILRAKDEFKNVTLQTYFEISICDIELDIYRLGFEPIALLGEAIWKGNQDALRQSNNRAASILLARHKLATAELDDTLRERLRQYGDYRYKGSMQISKSSEVDRIKRHQTLAEIHTEIDERLKEATEEDKRILTSLQEYISVSLLFATSPDVAADIESAETYQS